MTDNQGKEFQPQINPQAIALRVCVSRPLGSRGERKRCSVEKTHADPMISEHLDWDLVLLIELCALV